MSDEHERRERAEQSAFKVVDRRRFTPQGDVRADAPADAAPRQPSPIAPSAAAEPQAPQASDAPAPKAAQTDAAANPARKPSASSVDFLSFISSLATNAMAALGLLPPSQSRGMPQNLNMAREYIDIIVMLQERTQGNLSAEEDHAMTQLIADLTGQYVALSRTQNPAGASPG